MILSNLDLDTLRTLIVANDLGGYGRAAMRLNRTPSAISLQMKRLQQEIGAPLFHKVGRGIVLTEAGELVLRYGRQMLALNDELVGTIRGASLEGTVRLGCSQDFVETVLPSVLSQFAALYPMVLLEVRVDGNATLVHAVDEGMLDIALVVGHAERPTAETLGEVQLVWIAGRAFSMRQDQAIPLVLLGPQCAFRKEALRRLDRAQLPWRLAAVSASLAGLWACAIGGLGVTARTALSLPAPLVSDRELLGLPALSSFPVTLHRRAGVRSEGIDRLGAILSNTVVATLPSSTPQRVRKMARSGRAAHMLIHPIHDV